MEWSKENIAFIQLMYILVSNLEYSSRNKIILIKIYHVANNKTSSRYICYIKNIVIALQIYQSVDKNESQGTRPIYNLATQLALQLPEKKITRIYYIFFFVLH